MATGYTRSIFGVLGSFKELFTEGTDETNDFICTPCKDRNNSFVEAAFYCCICDEYCCKSCLKVHKSFKANKGHQVYGRDQKDMWGQQVRSSMLPTEVCPDHPGETLQMFCMEDQMLCCNVCVSLNHRTCHGMSYIPKLSSGIKESQDLSTVNQTIGQFMELVNEMIESDKKAKVSIDKLKAEYLNNIKKIRQQVNAFFHSLEKKANTEMDKVLADTEKDLQKHMKALCDIKDKLAHLHTAIQPTNTNNESQLFIEMFTAQQQLPQFKHELHGLAETPQVTGLHFTKNPKLQKMFATVKSLAEMKMETTTIKRKLKDIKSLPLLQTKQPSSSVALSPSTTTTPPPPVPPRNIPKQLPNQLSTATNGRDINVKLSSDKIISQIYGSCQMPNGDILLTDYRNKKVKRLNIKYEPTDYLNLLYSTIAICCTVDTEAVITDNNSSIHFLSITRNRMSVTRSIKLNHLCYGIAHHNGRLFVSDSSNKVYIYTTSGQCLKTLQTDNNGVDMFSCTLHICVSPDGSKIYVADQFIGLVTLDGEGNHLSTYNNKNLDRARGVCVDRQGRVLVCGWRSHNVHQLDEGGSKLVAVVVGIPDLCSVCIDNHNSTLIASMIESVHVYNHIKVFDLNK